MDETLQRLKNEARRLSPGERLELAEDLLGSLEDFAGPFAAEWMAEAEDRLAGFRSGDLATVPMRDVLGTSRRS
jgi:putative addiction module component (TIGR02574 family)